MRKLIKYVLVLFAASAMTIGLSMVICNSKPVDIHSKVKELKEYCASKGYNTDYAILVDYGRISLQQRMFVYDFNQD